MYEEKKGKEEMKVEEEWRMLQQPTCQREVWIDDCRRVA
jgi:hypothetical protein